MLAFHLDANGGMGGGQEAEQNTNESGRTF